MRFFAFIVVSFLLLAPTVQAEKILVRTKVSASNLHPDGMRLFHSFDLDLPQGTHQLEFRDIPFEGAAQFASMQFDFGGAKASISGFSYGDFGLKPWPSLESDEERAAHLDFQKAQSNLWSLENKKRDQSNAITAAKARLAYLDSLKIRGEVETEGVKENASSIAENTQAIGQQYLAALQAIGNAEQAIAMLAEKLAKAERQFKAAQEYWHSFPSGDRNDRALYFTLKLEEAYSGRATVSILSDFGAWEANYELHLTQDNAAGSAVLYRRALIVQGTSENWEDISAVLSTAKIYARTSIRDPNMLVGTVEEKPKQKKNSSGYDSREGAVSEPVMEPIVMEEHSSNSAWISSGTPPVLKGQILEFTLSDPLSLKSEGEAVVWLDQLNLDVDLSVKIVSFRSESAFLIAKLNNSTSGPILPGLVSIYRDGAYIGDGEIPSVGIGEEFELSFGEYDGIEVNRNLVEKFDSDIGLITSTNRRVLRHRTTITSHLDFAMPVRVLDGVPVSEDENLEIKMLARPAPSEQDVDGKRGVVAWQFELPAGDKKRIEFGYEAQWPPDMVFKTK